MNHIENSKVSSIYTLLSSMFQIGTLKKEKINRKNSYLGELLFLIRLECTGIFFKMCLERSHFTIKKHYIRESSVLIPHNEMTQNKGRYNLTHSCFAV